MNPGRQINVYYTFSPLLHDAHFFLTDPFEEVTIRQFVVALALSTGRIYEDYEPIVFHVASRQNLAPDDTFAQAGIKENDVLLVLELPPGFPISLVGTKMPARLEGDLPAAIRGKARRGGFTLDELDEAREKQRPSETHYYGDVFNDIKGVVVARSGQAGNIQVKHSSAECEQLAVALKALLENMRAGADSPEKFFAAGEVAAAVGAAEKGDEQSSLDHLKKAGKWALDVATKIGSEVASAAIKHSLGLK